MELVTIEIGPPWKMQVLLGLLAQHGVLAFVVENWDLGTYGSLMPAQLRVPEDAVEAAQAVLAEQRVQAADPAFDG